MPDLLKRLDARAERGFSMFLVIMAMFVTSMFVAAAFAAANGDLPVAGVATERKSDYAAAEAGLNYYLTRLQQDPDYWTKCDTGAAPNGTEDNPVNQVNAATQRWRKIDGTNDWYKIELLPAKNYEAAGDTYHTTCDPKKQQTFVDNNTGTFRIRATGRVGTASNARTRSIIATFRRDSFLNFVYFTNYENRDPAAETDAAKRATQIKNCSNKYRSQRSGCTEIQFATGDAVNGPLHSNDESLLVCGSPTFGRAQVGDRRYGDTIEVRGGSPGYSGCAGSTPTINTPTTGFTTTAKLLAMPESNEQLKSVAQTSNSLYTGLTYIRLNGASMSITNNGTTTTAQWPTSGVVYVQTDKTCDGESPIAADYANEPVTCGNVYVSGTYSKSLTIAAENDVIIAPTGGASSPDITQVAASDSTLGLIANNFVRVGHRVGSGCGENLLPAFKTITIEAAILALQHSFIVDNYQCGAAMTKLNVTGAIVQKFRGPVGTGSSGGGIASGYLKNYYYDDRFRYRSPPYFLTPVAAAWDIVRSHEVVKGS
jgi:Tfp pilus assembly protein PilX